MARVTVRQPAHFHILSDVLVDRTQLLTAPFLYLCAHVHSVVCVINCAPTYIPESSGLLNVRAVCVTTTATEEKRVSEDVEGRREAHTSTLQVVSQLANRGYYFNVCHFLLS